MRDRAERGAGGVRRRTGPGTGPGIGPGTGPGIGSVLGLGLVLGLTLGSVSGCEAERRRIIGNQGPTTGGGRSVDAGTGAGGAGARCGDGVVQGLEACDGERFAGESSCAAWGLGAGALGCSSRCTLLFDGCSSSDVCAATGAYDDRGCDACPRLGGQVDPGCTRYCGSDDVCAERFDARIGVWTCRDQVGAPDPDCGRCGDGRVSGDERCDGEAFAEGARACTDLGFGGGSLGCSADCLPDTSRCTSGGGGTPGPRCGDGRREGEEACDGDDLGEASCASVTGGVGRLACTEGCRYDVSGCVGERPPGCGNGRIDEEERCDGADLGGWSCQELGFLEGALGCTGDCQFDVGDCEGGNGARCGDGRRDSGEACDGSDFGGQTCVDHEFAGGRLGCTTRCTIEYSGCVSSICGDGVRQGTEACDGRDFGGRSCADYGFMEGTLSCDELCRVETSGCRGT